MLSVKCWFLFLEVNSSSVFLIPKFFFLNFPMFLTSQLVCGFILVVTYQVTMKCVLTSVKSWMLQSGFGWLWPFYLAYCINPESWAAAAPVLMPTCCSPNQLKRCAFTPFTPALATLEAAKLAASLVQGLEARLTTLRDGVVDIPSAEAAVERTQVRGTERQVDFGKNWLCVVDKWEAVFSLASDFFTL